MFIKKHRVLLSIAAVISIACCIRLLYYFPKQLRPISNDRPFEASLHGNETTNLSPNLQRDSYVKIHPFNISGYDVMVCLHIPKTSGTYFAKQLIGNLELERKCTLANQQK